MLDRLQALFSGEPETSEPSVQVPNTTPIDTETIDFVANDTPELNTEDLTSILNDVQEYCELGFADDRPEEHPITELLQTQYNRDAIEHTVTTKQSTFASIIKGERWQTIGNRLGISPKELKAVQEAHNRYLANMDTGMVGITVNGIVVEKPSGDESMSSPRNVAPDQTTDTAPADTPSETQEHGSVADSDTSSEIGSDTEPDVDFSIEHAKSSDDSGSIDSEAEGSNTTPPVEQQASEASNNTDTSTAADLSAPEVRSSDPDSPDTFDVNASAPSDSQYSNRQSSPTQSDPDADHISGPGEGSASDTDSLANDDEPLSSTELDMDAGEYKSSDNQSEGPDIDHSSTLSEEDDTDGTSKGDEPDSESPSTSDEQPNAEVSSNNPPSDNVKPASEPPVENNQPVDPPSRPDETQDITTPPTEPSSQSSPSTTESNESPDSKVNNSEDDPLAEIEELLSDTQDEE